MKEIENYEDYLIDKNGDIFSIKRNKILKQATDKDGYKYIGLCKDGKQKFFKVHRLIAFAYIENNNIKFDIINHKNGKRDDNRIENLEWCDIMYNSQSKNTKRNIGYINETKFNTFRAQIIINGKIYSKCFKTREEAEAFNLDKSACS